MTDANIEAINKKLHQEEEWLKNFSSNISKSQQIKSGIESIIDNFQRKLKSLEENVLPMHEENGRLQVKQHNIQRLVNTIDATVQFYGRTQELELTIRDGNPMHNLSNYLEHMDSLGQAIQFFESNPNYQDKTENMKITVDSGYTILENQYKLLLQRNTVPGDPGIIIICLDDQYELMSSKVKEIVTIKELEEICTLGSWLLERGRTTFLGYYADIRSENMMRSITSVVQHHTALTSRLQSRSMALKHALKKSNRSEKIDRKEELCGAAEEGALLLLGCLLALLEIEEGIMQKAIPDTSKQAQVFLNVVRKPLAFVIRHVYRVVQESDSGVIPLLPLLRFLATHQMRLGNLARNSSDDIPFDQLIRTIRTNAASYINEFVEGLRNDVNKFVPLDGNVHPITANTLNFLVTLTLHRHTVTQQLLSLTAPPGDNPALLLPKLFARILSALGTSLKRKAENYDDTTLSKLFLLNNYHYIARTLADEEAALLPVINEQNTQILSFYQAEIDKCVEQYMTSWNPTLSYVFGLEKVGDDKNTLRNMLYNFVREFDLVCNIQRTYCITDAKLASEVRERVKRLLVPKFNDLMERTRSFEKQMKYSEESFKITIDRLFDVTA
ncbi:unnamed protein product [Auanema sp. JU1783]|nr:unnamed protein product [Auanema sp. JU1783]